MFLEVFPWKPNLHLMFAQKYNCVRETCNLNHYINLLHCVSGSKQRTIYLFVHETPVTTSQSIDVYFFKKIHVAIKI